MSAQGLDTHLFVKVPRLSRVHFIWYACKSVHNTLIISN